MKKQTMAVIACIAGMTMLVGGANAAGLVTSADIKDGTIRARDMKAPLLKRLSKPGPAGPVGPAGTNGTDGIDGTDGVNGTNGKGGTSSAKTSSNSRGTPFAWNVTHPVAAVRVDTTAAYLVHATAVWSVTGPGHLECEFWESTAEGVLRDGMGHLTMGATAAAGDDSSYEFISLGASGVAPRGNSFHGPKLTAGSTFEMSCLGFGGSGEDYFLKVNLTLVPLVAGTQAEYPAIP